MAGRKYSTRYAKFQVSGYASRGGTRFGANEKTYLKKYFFAFLLFAKALLSVTPLFPIWRVIATRQNCSVGFMLFHFCFL
jgi:hypothetical protein